MPSDSFPSAPSGQSWRYVTCSPGGRTRYPCSWIPPAGGPTTARYRRKHIEPRSRALLHILPHATSNNGTMQNGDENALEGSLLCLIIPGTAVLKRGRCHLMQHVIPQLRTLCRRYPDTLSPRGLRSQCGESTNVHLTQFERHVGA